MTGRSAKEDVDVAGIVTGEAVVLDLRVARLASRTVALAIDIAVQLVLLIVALTLVAAVSGSFDSAAARAVGLSFFVLVIVGYPVLWETLWQGRSPGKAALGLRVVSDDGGPEHFRQALFRGLAGFVEIWLTVGSVALIASLASRRGKRLGDVFSGTIVVQERLPVHGGPVPWMPPRLAGWAAGLELSRLPDEVALMARQYVSRFAELAPAPREQMGRQMAATVAAYVSPPPPIGTPPVAYLSAVLAERRRRADVRMSSLRQEACSGSRASSGRATPGPRPQEYGRGSQTPGPGSPQPGGVPATWPSGHPSSGPAPRDAGGFVPPD